MQQPLRDNWAALGYPVIHKFNYPNQQRHMLILRAAQGIDCLTFPDNRAVWYGFKNEEDLKTMRQRIHWRVTQ